MTDARCEATAISTNERCLNTPKPKSKWCGDHQDPSTRAADVPAATAGPVEFTNTAAVARVVEAFKNRSPDGTLENLGTRDGKLFDILFTAAAGDTPMVWGQVGIGKTASIQKYIDDMGYHFAALSAAQVGDATAYTGMPVATVAVDGEVSVPKALPQWFRDILEREQAANEAGVAANPTVLFIDETTAADEPSLNAMLQLINERMVGNYKLPPNVQIICAGNRVADSEHAVELPAALSNRLRHFLMPVPEASEWAEHMHEEARVCAPMFADIWVMWTDRLAEFAKTQPSFFDANSEKNVELRETQETFGSPRAASKAVAALAELSQFMTYPNARAASQVDSAIGQHWGSQFRHFIENLSLPDPEEWIENPETALVAISGDTDAVAVNLTLSAIVGRLTIDPPAGQKNVKKWQRTRLENVVRVLTGAQSSSFKSAANAATMRLIRNQQGVLGDIDPTVKAEFHKVAKHLMNDWTKMEETAKAVIASAKATRANQTT